MEVSQSESQFSITLVAKFSAGRPPIQTIRDHINSSWGLQHHAVVGLLDPRHVMIRLASRESFVKAWSRESHVEK